MSLSSYDSGYSSVGRLEQFRTQHELARNFYDDLEFCPLLGFEEVAAHRSRIQQRSPYSSPRSSPPTSYNTVTTSPSKLRAIPIINPENMAPVRMQQQQTHRYYHQQDSPPLAQWQSFHPQHYYQLSHQQDRPSSVSSTSSVLSSSASSFSSSLASSSSSSSSSATSSVNYSRVIPIINPSTGQPLLRSTMYDVTVR